MEQTDSSPKIQLTNPNYLVQCAHCNGTGTCKNGKNGSSCAACVKHNELKKGEHIGLACGSCGGLGKTDSFTHKINNRATPLLALMVLWGSLVLIVIFGFFKSEFFSQILTFCGTLCGSATAYYFGNRMDK